MWYCQVLDCLKITWRVLRYSLRHKASSRGFRNPLGTFACNSFILCARCASVEGSEIRCFIQRRPRYGNPWQLVRFSEKPGVGNYRQEVELLSGCHHYFNQNMGPPEWTLNAEAYRRVLSVNPFVPNGIVFFEVLHIPVLGRSTSMQSG